ncbi:MAG: hypothetical protein ABIZ69_09610 [Ilumatobacteraceae bacterium]
MVGLALTAGVVTAAAGDGLSVNWTRNVARAVRSPSARFIAVYCSTKVSRSVS